VGRETATLTRFCDRVRAAAPGVPLECTGFVPYTDVAAQLALADLGIVPYEASTGVHCAFVAKIVEYLGVGIPVVSTPLQGAQRYFAREAAVWFTDFDGLSFGDAILGWLQRPVVERRALALKASVRVATELDWAVICSRAVSFIERIQQAS
jgi:glycosyltransferase involved in cell wall biosynthesis